MRDGVPRVRSAGCTTFREHKGLKQDWDDPAFSERQLKEYGTIRLWERKLGLDRGKEDGNGCWVLDLDGKYPRRGGRIWGSRESSTLGENERLVSQALDLLPVLGW